MNVLVLGGTHHVGRSVVEEALARGDSVTTVTRGVSGPPSRGAISLHADRLHSTTVEAALATGSWDAVIDTWSGAPCAVRDAAAVLRSRVAHYAYVSSRSVYRWPIPIGLDEDGPVVDGDPAATDAASYAAAKRGGELATLEAFGTHALVARAGLILGPYEQVGRLPWWLRRMERGGRVLAPGPEDGPLQYIDGRDLARWLLACAETGVGGVYNTVSVAGHTTMGALLRAANDATGRRADLTWVAPSLVLAAGIEPWTELPIWVPPHSELAGLHGGDVSAALAQGLRCRPMTATVADTWAWLQREGDPPSLSAGTIGLDPGREAALLATIA
jgi:nucleoside-diphosphate-sugar epimerase